MSLWRALICLLLPPLAVIDKGCGTLLIVCVLTLAGWMGYRGPLPLFLSA